MTRCTLHPDATETCPCCRSNIRERDLYIPVTLALWQCPNGHQEAAAPFLKWAAAECRRCPKTLEWVVSGVWTPKRPDRRMG